MALSCFALEDGVVYHTYSCFDRGTDVLNLTWQLLDRAPQGRGEDFSRLAAQARRVRRRRGSGRQRVMGKVGFDISMSLDGFIAGPDDGHRAGPRRRGGERLHEWAYDLASFHERHGRRGRRDATATTRSCAEAFETGGAAVLMGRRMFDMAEAAWGERASRSTHTGVRGRPPRARGHAASRKVEPSFHVRQRRRRERARPRRRTRHWREGRLGGRRRGGDPAVPFAPGLLDEFPRSAHRLRAPRCQPAGCWRPRHRRGRDRRHG